MRFGLLLLASLFPASGAFAATQAPLVIYIYDSFFGGESRKVLEKEIQARSGHPVQWVVAGDAAQVVSRHQLDLRKGKSRANLLIGIDESTFPAVAADALAVDEQKVPALKHVEPKLRRNSKLVPYNYGVPALMVDTEKLPEVEWPKRWDDLLKPSLKKKLILEDPRTSTPGLSFLLASRVVWKDRFAANWKQLRGQWLTLAPGWSHAYGIFQKGEAPLVWSYTTSQAYHQLAKPPSARYRAIVFEEGNPVQVEGAVVPVGAPGGEELRKAAFVALEVILSEEIQARIPSAQWMMPARKGVPLPWAKVSPAIPEPKSVLEVPTDAEFVRETLKLWSDAIR